jgi:diacylglycerol diphosphate phosphatase/phosphatidate phosphatase
VTGAIELAANPRHLFQTCAFAKNICNVTSVGWDATLANPWAKTETVSVPVLMCIAYLIPLVVVTAVQLWFCRPKTGWPWRHDTHHFALTLLGATGLTILVTGSAKRYVGFYRPSYYSLVQDDKLSEHEKIDGRQSYPSGHASLAFASMVTLCLYLLGKTRAVAGGPGQLVKVLGCVSFVGLALFVACSRIVDYRHHPADVNAGAMLGSAVAALYYHIYFPPVWQSDAHVPRVGGDTTPYQPIHPDDLGLPVSM